MPLNAQSTPIRRARPDNASRNTVYETINDTGGTDTLDFSAYTTDATVDLNKQAWSSPSSAQLGNIYNAENAPGEIAIGSNTDIENVTTGSGADTITGNAMNNAVNAGTGTDTYVVTGAYKSYNYNKISGVVTLVDTVGSDGTDTLTAVESIQFSDQTISVSILLGARRKATW